VIHLTSAFKFDIFRFVRTPTARLPSLGAGLPTFTRSAPEPLECAIAAPEDTILRKLEWYRTGGETSERQWNDLRGVMRVSGDTLDCNYLRRWALYLNVDDLLERLLGERYDA
jgi:hypothetical protein